MLALLDSVTAELPELGDRRSDEFRTLRKTLGYAWSVAVVALPDEGKPLFERLLGSDDPDVHWVVRENLRKKRRVRMDREWVEGCLSDITSETGSPRPQSAALESDETPR